MAKKKYEFKPDRISLGFFHKLYLTKKQRISILKWLLYALVLLVMSLLQDVILCKLDIFGATTDLVPCAIFLTCMLLGTQSGCVYALVAACLFQFSGSGPGYHAIAIITILCVAGAIFRQSFLRKGFGSCLLCAGGCHILYELTVFFAGLILGQTILARIGVALFTGILSLMCIPVLYPILRSIEKIGGETWKE